jgi:curli biogenesis system outer membrane secretion channel CsgG
MYLKAKQLAQTELKKDCKMNKSLLFFFIFALLNTRASLAQFGPRLECFTLHAPVVILSDVKQIAVLDFESQGSYFDNKMGATMADKLVSALMESERGLSAVSTTFMGAAQRGKPFFKGAKTNIYDILERNRMDKIMEEQKLVASGVIDDSKAIELGKILGVQAMIFGQIMLSSKDNQTTFDTKDSKGNTIKNYRTQRTVTVSVSMRVVSTETGKILATATEEENRTESRVQVNNYPNVSTPQALALTALDEIAYRFANHISPYYQFDSFEILKIKEKEFRDRAKNARDLANIGQIEKAYPIYRTIIEQDPYNADAAYNVGILYEAAGDYAKALEMYTRASEVVPEDRTISRAKNRCQQTADMVEKLKKLGINIEPLPFEKTQVAVSMGSTVKTKGNRSERWEVYSEKSRASQVVMRVPGGSEFEIIENEGDWVKIKLLGGKEGYISRENLSR